MARGGYRPGAGRKPGSKDTKPRKGTEARAEAEKITAMLAMGIKAKAKFYQDFLVRVANKDGQQKPLSLAEKKLMNQLAVELAKETREKPGSTNLEAGEFLRQVWNDPSVEISLRIRAAEIVFRDVCEQKGKKEEKQDRAERAAAGKFAPSKPPLTVVK